MYYSSSTSFLDRWDLAPGEPISQSTPLRAAQEEVTLLCPAPTMDTEANSDFLAHHASSQDCSSLDSLAGFDLASGEARSQSPLGTSHGSQIPQCPPPTLDTREFETYSESEDVWIVEDSLACSDLLQDKCRPLGPVLDILSAPNHFRPPPLQSQELRESSRVLSSDVWLVEDSLASWDCAPSEVRSQGPLTEWNDFKSLGFPFSVDELGCTTDVKNQRALPRRNVTPLDCDLEAGNSMKMLLPTSKAPAKRNISPTSQHGGSEKPYKQLISDPKSIYSNEFTRIGPVLSTNRSICTDSVRKASNFGDTEDLRKQNLDFSELQDHTLPETVPPNNLDAKQAGTNVNDDRYRKASLLSFARMDVTKSRDSGARSLAKLNLDSLSCFSESREDNCAAEGVTYIADFSSQNGAVSESQELGHQTKVAGLQKTRNGGESIANVQKASDEPILPSFSLESRTSINSAKPSSNGWLCPRSLKKVRPTSKQLSLDRYRSFV